MLPSGPIAVSRGWLTRDASAGPPSPANPAVPFPAMVLMIEVRDTAAAAPGRHGFRAARVAETTTTIDVRHRLGIEGSSRPRLCGFSGSGRGLDQLDRSSAVAAGLAAVAAVEDDELRRAAGAERQQGVDLVAVPRRGRDRQRGPAGGAVVQHHE